MKDNDDDDELFVELSVGVFFYFIFIYFFYHKSLAPIWRVRWTASYPLFNVGLDLVCKW